jgi:serine protease Do
VLAGGPTSGDQAYAASQRETPIVLAVRRAQPSVVNISSEKTVVGRNGWENSLSAAQRVNGMGSGVVIDERGYIITNAHVVDRVTSLRVKLLDGGTHDATVIGIDRGTDLALVKIDAGRPLPTIPLGTSHDLMIGETVIAVGNAYGYENTVTRGIISALGRTVKLNDELTYHDLIQTDSSINPGNSGGALLNIDGDLVGVNVAIRAGASGISFAIPVDTMRRIAADMMSIRKVNRTWHGLTYREAARGDASHIDLVVDKADGPAHSAGFRPGDRIVRLADRPVRNAIDVERGLLGLRAGDRTTVVVRRGESDETLTLTIEPLAESPSELVWRRLGLRLSSIDAHQVQRFQSHLRGGMFVLQVQQGSPAANAGVQPGDYLVGLQQFETLNYDNVLSILTKQEPGSYDPIRVHVLRDGQHYEFQARLASARNDAGATRR